MKRRSAVGGMVLLTATLANVAVGSEAVLNRNDGNSNPSAFNGLPAYWTPNVNPASAEGAATDFIVKNNLSLRTPDGNVEATFGGKSLTLGAADYSSAGTIIYKSNGYKITIPNLIVYKGNLSAATSFDGGGINTHFAGKATLYTTYASPFTYGFTKTEHDKMAYFDFVLTGDETTAVKLSGSSASSRLYLRQSQADTYSGSWIFGPNQYVYVDGNHKINSVAVFTSSQAAFGKPLSAFNPKSIFFDDGNQFRFEATSKTLSASDNRGITIADNGTLTFVLVNNIVLDCGYPLAGTGATAAFVGNGTLKLRANASVLLKPGDTTKLALVGSAAADGGIDISNGQMMTVGAAATDRVSANGAKLANAMLCFNVAADGSNAAQLRLSGALDVTGRIGLGFSAVPGVSATTDIPVLVIDKNVSRAFTEADFDPWGSAGYQIPNAEKVVLSTNDDGDTVVSIRVFPYVRSNRGDNTICSMTASNEWTPNCKPSEGKAGDHYIVWGYNRLRTGRNDKTTYTAPGDLWVFYPTTGGSASYESKEEKMTFTKARLLNGTKFETAQGASWTMTWAGDYDIRTTPGYAVQFSNWGMKAAIVTANLTGRGAIMAHCVCDGKYAPYEIRFLGENAGFVGTFQVGDRSPTAANYGHLVIAKEENLGGGPAAFAADAFRLGTKMQLNPTAALTIDDPNRGVTFAPTSSVSTAHGDVTIKTPVVFAGAFEKAGAGTFAYGEGGVTVAAGAAITVSGGALKPLHKDALKGATVSFADGVTLALDAKTGALDCTTTTLGSAGGSFNVSVDNLERQTAIATFASAEIAAVFVANAKTLPGPDGRKPVLTADGATVKAAAPGMAVFVR